MTMSSTRILGLLGVVLFLSFTHSQEGEASTYKRLIAKGYATGPLITHYTGNMGWYVRGKDKKFFCR